MVGCIPYPKNGLIFALLSIKTVGEALIIQKINLSSLLASTHGCYGREKESDGRITFEINYCIIVSCIYLRCVTWMQHFLQLRTVAGS